MLNLIKNPLTHWFILLVKSNILEKKHKSKNLKIGYLSNINNCKYGLSNTIGKHNLINNSEFGDFTYITNSTEINKTIIGKFCSIGPRCCIGLNSHPTKRFVSTHPIFFSTLKQAQITFSDKNYYQESEPISIGHDVWIGANVTILDGLNIGNGVIVGAGSVVTKDIPDYAIVGGVPAKVIRYRFGPEYISYLLKIKWWDKDIKWLKDNFKKFHDINLFVIHEK